MSHSHASRRPGVDRAAVIRIAAGLPALERELAKIRAAWPEIRVRLEAEDRIAQRIVRAEMAKLRAVWPEIRARLEAEERAVAEQTREDRRYAELLSPASTEADRHAAAEAIVETFPIKLSGGRRRWRAWTAAAADVGMDHRAYLRWLLVRGLLHAADQTRLARRGTIKIGYDDGAGLRFRVYRDTAPAALPPGDLRRWVMRQAYREAESVIGVADLPDADAWRVAAERGATALMTGRTAQATRATLPAVMWADVAARLSPRERAVFDLLTEGESTARIAEALQTTPANIRVLKHRIGRKAARGR